MMHRPTNSSTNRIMVSKQAPTNKSKAVSIEDFSFSEKPKTESMGFENQMHPEQMQSMVTALETKMNTILEQQKAGQEEKIVLLQEKNDLLEKQIAVFERNKASQDKQIAVLQTKNSGLEKHYALLELEHSLLEKSYAILERNLALLKKKIAGFGRKIVL
ncbi:MAG: hypothetical protein SGBAC_005751 [Bacillariaceae sp.]